MVLPQQGFDLLDCGLGMSVRLRVMRRRCFNFNAQFGTKFLELAPELWAIVTSDGGWPAKIGEPLLQFACHSCCCLLPEEIDKRIARVPVAHDLVLLPLYGVQVYWDFFHGIMVASLVALRELPSCFFSTLCFPLKTCKPLTF